MCNFLYNSDANKTSGANILASTSAEQSMSELVIVLFRPVQTDIYIILYSVREFMRAQTPRHGVGHTVNKLLIFFLNVIYFNIYTQAILSTILILIARNHINKLWCLLNETQLVILPSKTHKVFLNGI